MHDVGRRERGQVPSDALGVVASWSYDSLGRLTRQTDDAGGFNRHTDKAYDHTLRVGLSYRFWAPPPVLIVPGVDAKY